MGDDTAIFALLLMAVLLIFNIIVWIADDMSATRKEYDELERWLNNETKGDDHGKTHHTTH